MGMDYFSVLAGLLGLWVFLIWFIRRTVIDITNYMQSGNVNGERLTKWDILNGLSSGEFGVVYQPQYSLVTGDITGIEALARWVRTDGGFVSPLDFIDLAEKVGVITNVGHYVMRKSCEDYRKIGFNGLILSVNVSLVELESDDYISRLDEIIEETGFDTNYLKLEVTESKVYSSREKIESVVSSIRDRGISIVVDDFGTGVSTHDKLSITGIEGMKIDKSFVLGIDTAPHNKILIEHMVSLGKKLNMSIVAEGVETYEHLHYIAMLGVDTVQGYYISRPMQALDLAEWLYSTDRGRTLVDIDKLYNSNVLMKSL